MDLFNKNKISVLMSNLRRTGFNPDKEIQVLFLLVIALLVIDFHTIERGDVL